MNLNAIAIARLLGRNPLLAHLNLGGNLLPPLLLTLPPANAIEDPGATRIARALISHNTNLRWLSLNRMTRPLLMLIASDSPFTELACNLFADAIRCRHLSHLELSSNDCFTIPDVSLAGRVSGSEELAQQFRDAIRMNRNVVYFTYNCTGS
jgi:hypothetical protein